MPQTLPRTSPPVARKGAAAIPGWVEPLLAGAAPQVQAIGEVQLITRQGSEFALVSARVAGFRQLDRQGCTGCAQRVYGLLAAALAPLAANQPVRFWNHIPGIHDEVGQQQDRYMAFNAGRFAAFVDWVGDAGRFAQAVATASGVGAAGDDLVTHVLAARRPGLAVDNPRQVPPFRYSRRYGLRPPCFARATLLGDRLLIGGTASIRGEDSVHMGDLGQQLAETLTNIEALLARASELSSLPFSLSSLRHVRTYHPRPVDRPLLEATLRQRLGSASFEWSAVPLCRRELLVEIEAMAQINRPYNRSRPRRSHA